MYYGSCEHFKCDNIHLTTIGVGPVNTGRRMTKINRRIDRSVMNTYHTDSSTYRTNRTNRFERARSPVKTEVPCSNNRDVNDDNDNGDGNNNMKPELIGKLLTEDFFVHKSGDSDNELDDEIVEYLNSNDDVDLCEKSIFR
jgi:hypothetical protein